MNLRSLDGILLTLLGGWLFWGGLNPVLLLVQRGSPLADALLSPPTGIIRLVAAALIVIGGILILLKTRGGAWISGIGVGLFVLLTALMILSGSDSKLWGDEVVYSLFLIVFWLTAAFLPRTRACTE